MDEMTDVNSKKAAIKSGTQYNINQNQIHEADKTVCTQITDLLARPAVSFATTVKSTSVIRNRRHSFAYLKAALRTTTTSTIGNLLTLYPKVDFNGFVQLMVD